MQVYVRLGIRLLYKGAVSRLEGARGACVRLSSPSLTWPDAWQRVNCSSRSRSSRASSTTRQSPHGTSRRSSGSTN